MSQALEQEVLAEQVGTTVTTETVVTEAILEAAQHESAAMSAAQCWVPGTVAPEGVLSLPGTAAEASVPYNALGGLDTATGEFSISDWDGYPEGLPRPGGPFRLIEGEEYNLARNQASCENRMLRGLFDVPRGTEIHEIQPVKFGGSPTDPANKVILDAPYHRGVVTPWWNALKGGLGQ